MSRVDDAVERAARAADDFDAHGGVSLADVSHDLVRAQLSEYLDGSLSDPDRDRMDRHLDGCLDCLACLKTLRQTVKMLGELPARSAPPDAKASIVERGLLGE